MKTRDELEIPFPHPIRGVDLEAFCHPVPGDVFSLPVYHEGEALAANGYLAIRSHNGRWLPGDFRPASPAFLERFSKIDWELPEDRNGEAREVEWRALDHFKQTIFKYKPWPVWKLDALWPAVPLVRVAGGHLVRLSMLQLIARLPRCEVFAGVQARGGLHFRFTGGRGIIARSEALERAVRLERHKVAFEVMKPQTHEDGERVRHNSGPSVLPQKEPYWKEFTKI